MNALTCRDYYGLKLEKQGRCCSAASSACHKLSFIALYLLDRSNKKADAAGFIRRSLLIEDTLVRQHRRASKAFTLICRCMIGSNTRPTLPLWTAMSRPRP